MNVLRESSNHLVPLLGFWILLLIVSYSISASTALSFVQLATVVSMFGTVGIFLLQYLNTFANQQKTKERESDENPSSSSDDASSTEEQETPATPGLDVTERKVQNAFIKKAYQRFYDNPITFSASYCSHILIQEIAEEEDVDEEVVKKVWQMSKDDGFFKRRSGSNAWFFSPKGIWRAEALGEEILMDEAVQDEILNVLLQSYRDEPRFSRVERKDLISAVGKPEKVVDHNVWWLQEKRYVELHSGMGVDAGYRSLEITDLGRKVAQ